MAILGGGDAHLTDEGGGGDEVTILENHRSGDVIVTRPGTALDGDSLERFAGMKHNVSNILPFRRKNTKI